MGDDGKAVSFHYCGRLCQQKDWPQHKELCNRLRARRELQRAAETLQQIWHAFRAELFPYAPPIKLEERDGVLYLYDEPDPAARGWQLGPFPDDVAKEERDRKAVLVLYTCAVAVGCLDGTIRLFLKDLCSKLEELFFYSLPARPMKLVDGSGKVVEQSTEHWVVRATLRTSESEVFALDFTGAQFGYDEAMLPMPLYARTRIDPNGLSGLTVQWPLGTRKAQLEKGQLVPGKDKGYGGYGRTGFTVHSFFLDGTINTWCKREKITLSEMLKLPEDAFRKRQMELVRELKDSVRTTLGLKATVAAAMASMGVNV